MSGILIGVHGMSSGHVGRNVGGVESGALCVSSVKKLEKVDFRSSALSCSEAAVTDDFRTGIGLLFLSSDLTRVQKDLSER